MEGLLKGIFTLGGRRPCLESTERITCAAREAGNDLKRGGKAIVEEARLIIKLAY